MVHGVKDSTESNDKTKLEMELTSKVLEISKGNDFLLLLLDRLKKLNLTVGNGQARKDLFQIIDLIRTQTKSQKWEQFEHFISSGNSSYTKKLLEKHPDLTSNERRLCLLLQMTLSTKEISDMTLQSCRAVEMARHRIRKKFGLKREDNLVRYLAQFL